MCDQQSLRSACAYAQSDQSLCLSLEYYMTLRLLAEQHLEFLSQKRSFTGSSESTLAKMPHFLKSHVAAHIYAKLKIGGPFYGVTTADSESSDTPYHLQYGRQVSYMCCFTCMIHPILTWTPYLVCVLGKIKKK